MILPPLDRLKTQLMTAGIQQENMALFQVISQLIDYLRSISTQTQAAIGNSSTGLEGRSYLTTEKEPSLTNSKQELAGSGIQFNDSGGRRTISAAIPIGLDVSAEDGMDGFSIQGIPGIQGMPGIGMDGADGIDGESFPVPGPIGNIGPIGPAGLSGISGSKVVSFTAQTSVNVVHNFNAYPVVQVLEGLTLYIPLSVVHNSANDFTVTFTVAHSGYILASIGGVATAVTTTAANYAVLPEDNLIIATNALTITLPATAGLQGKTYSIKDMATSGLNVIIATTGGATIDGDATKTMIAKYTNMSLFTDGTNWFIL
jgi:hypothetical protein